MTDHEFFVKKKQELEQYSPCRMDAKGIPHYKIRSYWVCFDTKKFWTIVELLDPDDEIIICRAIQGRFVSAKIEKIWKLRKHYEFRMQGWLIGFVDPLSQEPGFWETGGDDEKKSAAES